jgi:hypothetical protein
MKIKWSPREGIELEFEATSQVDAIEQMGKHSEIFGIKKCGACQSTDIRFQARTVTKQVGKKMETYPYHELVCNNPSCRARLSFGKFQDDPGSVFPKRKDADGNYLENGGWVKFRKEDTSKDTKDEGAGF